MTTIELLELIFLILSAIVSLFVGYKVATEPYIGTTALGVFSSILMSSVCFTIFMLILIVSSNSKDVKVIKHSAKELYDVRVYDDQGEIAIYYKPTKEIVYQSDRYEDFKRIEKFNGFDLYYKEIFGPDYYENKIKFE